MVRLPQLAGTLQNRKRVVSECQGQKEGGGILFIYFFVCLFICSLIYLIAVDTHCQVYNIVILHVYTLGCQHCEGDHRLSPYNAIAV